MKVLVGCEESQAVCIAFRERGIEAYSCDLQDCSGGHPEWRLKMDVFEAIEKVKPNLFIGHPPCTFISYAATAHWNNPGRLQKRLDALIFFGRMWEVDVDMICLENPKGCASPTIAKYSQEIQPYYFGDRQIKTTWLWLKNLPPLKWNQHNTLFDLQTATERPEPTSIDNTPRQKKRYFTDGATRDGKIRSKTFPGIAKAMAEQWGDYILEQSQTELFSNKE